MHTKQDEVQLRNSLRERWGADFRSATDVPSIVSFERSIDADRKSGASEGKLAGHFGSVIWFRSRSRFNRSVVVNGRWTCFSVSDERDPCDPDTAGTRRGESMLDELVRRGGFFRGGCSAL